MPPSSASRSTACGYSRRNRCRPCPTPPNCWPPGCGGGQGRASSGRRIGTGRPAGDGRPRRPCRRGDISAQQPQQEVGRHRPETRRGRELFIELAGRFDIVGENFKAGTMDRLGLGYDVLAARYPALVWVSVSGFGNMGESPYRDWPAYAMVPEAMSGIYEYARPPGEAPRVTPSARWGTSARPVRRHRPPRRACAIGTRLAWVSGSTSPMLDSMIAMTDVVTNFWSLGRRSGLVDGSWRRSWRPNGWFATQVVREHQFARLAELVGHPEWIDDDRFAHPLGLDRTHRVGDPPRGRVVGGRPDAGRGVRRARSGRHRGRPVLHRSGGDRDEQWRRITCWWRWTEPTAWSTRC